MRHELRLLLLAECGSTTITQPEYDALAAASQGLLISTALEEQFDLLVENYIEFQTTILGLTARHAIVEIVDYMLLRLEGALLNRRISNFLSSSRAYIEAAPQHVENIFGAGSSPHVSVEAAIKAMTESHPSARAMHAIRNVVQHRALPIHEWGYEAEWDEGQTRLTYNPSMIVDPEEMAKVKGLRKSTKKLVDELHAAGQKLSVAPLMSESMEQIFAIHRSIRDQIGPNLAKWRELFSASVRRFMADNPGAPTISGFAAVAVTDRGEAVDPVRIFEKGYAYPDHLRLKNANMSRLSSVSVSSR